MKPLRIKGWDIYFHRLFEQQYAEIRSNVEKLQSKLEKEKLRLHPDVKLFQALVNLIYQTIPYNPFADYFVLKDSLKRYSRVKKKGLPNRYRLFFKVFKKQKKLVILWLGYPRKEGDKKDCYKVFSKMVNRGEFPLNIEQLIED